MTLELVTPLGALLAVAALVPLAVFVLSERRNALARRVLGLEAPRRRSRAANAVALAAVPCLLGAALAQPVLKFTDVHRVRTDAQAFYVFDISRSMLAAVRPGAATRLERSVRFASRMQASLSEVPSGVATMTDRVLPSLFPTANDEVFTATLDESLAINSPAPRGYEPVGTHFAALDTLAGTNFFDEGIPHRLAIVLTDGESRPYDTGDLRETLARGPRTSFVVVRFWQAEERVWKGDQPEGDYRADPLSAPAVETLARVTGARAFSEGELEEAVSAARGLLETGPLRDQGELLRVIALARWLVLAALVPLAFLLWRRNLV